MNVPSPAFIYFVFIGAIIFNLSAAPLWGRLVLLILNVAFFWTFVGGTVSALPYLCFLAVGYAGLCIIRRWPTTPVFLIFLVAVLFGFFDLKHYTFIPSVAYLPISYTAVGLSYVFFRVLHLIIDARQGAIPGKISPLTYINYTMNFTCLVSGPIQLYPDYKRTQQDLRLPLNIFSISRAVERMIVGYFKVAIVSLILQRAQQAWILDFAAVHSFKAHAVYGAGIGAIYPLFLYANFSGYTDFVIGAARLFRLELPENFDDPFSSENFISFWSRWHITLSNWLKTYVYMPLVMTSMRRLPSPALEPYFGVFSYFITFFLVGAWHGQTPAFLFFGVLQGGGVATNKLYQITMMRLLTRKGYRALASKPLYISFCRGLTFTWFAFTLLWFWSSWKQLTSFMSVGGVAATLAAWILVLVIATILLSLWSASNRFRRSETSAATQPPPSRYWRTVSATAMVIVLVTFTLILNGAAPDLVYKKF